MAKRSKLLSKIHLAWLVKFLFTHAKSGEFGIAPPVPGCGTGALKVAFCERLGSVKTDYGKFSRHMSMVES
jgi:hypothetical protein